VTTPAERTLPAVHGIVDPRFGAVVAEMAAAVARGEERGAAVAIFLDGRPVVDAWCGTRADGRPWSEDTLTVIFSATKGAVALMAQLLWDRGELDLDSPVTRYWPEYGAAGKRGALVRHLLDHTSGSLTFPRYWEVMKQDSLALADWELVTSRLAAARPCWKPGTRAGYHAITYGHLVGEVIRRITGMPPGAFFAQEVAGPLGLDISIGYHGAEDRVEGALPAPPPSDPAILQQGLAVLDMSQNALRTTGDVYNPAAWLVHAPIFMHPDRRDVGAYIAGLFSHPAIRAAEVPGSNGIGDARSLAGMYAPLSCGGATASTRLVSEESIRMFSTLQPKSSKDFHMGLGYAVMRDDIRPAHLPGVAFGHPGAGGILGFADPHHRMSFGYVHNQMLDETLTHRIAHTVYGCLEGRA
jgi:CubicO group peptidase (beta-lactamase class C family)